MDRRNPWHIMDDPPKPPIRTPGISNKKEDGSFEYQIINEWQLCPKCNGEGRKQEKVQMFYDFVTCDLCNGKKIISKVNGLPPGDTEHTEGYI